MEIKSPRIRLLLGQAGKIAGSGKRRAAEKLYREIIAEAPDTVPAWLGLAEVAADHAEREAAYRQALVLAPGHESALAGLARLEDPETGNGLPDIHMPTLQPVEPVATLPPVEIPVAPVKPENSLRGKNVTPVAPPAAGTPPVLDGRSGVGEKAAAGGTAVAFCANHPNRETTLRCNRCGKPICIQCARQTPVGYRCRECVREQEEVFFNATLRHYVLAILIALPLSLAAGLVAPGLRFFIIFLGAAVGSLIGRIVFRLSGRRRGRFLPHIVAAAVILGGAAPVLFAAGDAALQGGIQAGIAKLLAGGLWTAVYLAVATGAAYYQMK